MKKIKLFAFIAFSAMLAVSCSSDDGGSSVDSTEYFDYNKDGAEINITDWQAIRSEDSFEVMGTNPDGTSMYFNFDAHGNLARAGNTPANTSSDPWMNSFQNYTSHYFNFEIVAIDAAAHMIKVNYSGKLYEDDYDIDSAFSTVTGSFNVHYDVMAPAVADMHFNAKIAGNDWYGVSGGMSVYGFDDVHLWQTSGDEYQFDLNINADNYAVGTFSFTAASTANRVVLSKYDTATNQYVDYICSGTMAISSITDYSWTGKILTGTFNITAVNPDNPAQTIQVTNGSFKELYLP
jgi:hypothetical protein